MSYHTWRTGKWVPSWFDHNVLGTSRTQYYLFLHFVRQSGYSNDALHSGIADLISTYILPYCEGAEFDAHIKDEIYPEIKYAEYDNDEGLKKLKNLVDFVVDQNVDKTYTDKEIARLKAEYPEALVDALELKVAGRQQPAEETELEEAGDFPWIALILITIVAIWMLE